MNDAPKIVANETKETAMSPDKKPEVAGPTVAVPPVAQPAVAKK